MKLLLDTHIILWTLNDNPKLPKRAKEMILETLFFHSQHQKHNDPFDRIMIAQAKAEGLMFVTHDSKIPLYCETCVIEV
ncbi:MAG: hypothetical protein IJ679_09810 [Lachnospiraceae bacterium]|nr:hypothetical protein [Lachnospiraceae bacterium]